MDSSFSSSAPGATKTPSVKKKMRYQRTIALMKSLGSPEMKRLYSIRRTRRWNWRNSPIERSSSVLTTLSVTLKYGVTSTLTRRSSSQSDSYVARVTTTARPKKRSESGSRESMWCYFTIKCASTRRATSRSHESRSLESSTFRLTSQCHK